MNRNETNETIFSSGGSLFPYSTRILIVDDSDSPRNLLKAYLVRLGYSNVDQALDGQQALEKMWLAQSSAKAYGLVISDLNMPKLNGLDLLARVRQVPEWKELAFLLLTTESEKDKVLTAITLGASNYIVKPIDEDTLRLKLIKTWVKVKK